MNFFFLKIRKIILERKIIDFLILFLFILGVGFLFYYLSLTKTIKPKIGGIYREGLFETLNSLNPLLPKNESEKSILNIIYPPLVEYDNGVLISKFLKSYYFSPDYLTLAFELKDLKWSDGSELTTDDLAFSFDLFKKSGPSDFINNFRNVEIKIIDKKRAEFHLKFNDNYFLSSLKNFKILPAKTYAKADFDNFNLDLLKIGSGPFVFDSLKTRNDLTIIKLKRNTFYQPQPYLDEIHFYVFPSAKAAFDALILKEIDGLAGINYFDLPQNVYFNYQIYSITLPRVIGLFFNSQKVKPEIVNVLNQAIDRQKIVKDIFKDKAEISFGVFSPKVRKVLNLDNLNFNSTSASQKLSLKIIIPSSYFYPDIGRWLKEHYGLETEFIKPEDLNEILTGKDYEGVLSGLNFNYYPSIVSFFSKLGYNINNLDDVDLERGFQDLITNPQTKINEKLMAIEKKLLRFNVFLTNPHYLYFLNKNIAGFDQFFLPAPEFRFIKLEFWYQK
ncbi:MAG: hypothetical protein KatS3mg096_092 [Candidatus Parcubacteria bacterium]|nr:MAG: hypothetical protein KatS3mg096_092 [Candidatus Parcubacteria bacterium]